VQAETEFHERAEVVMVDVPRVNRRDMLRSHDPRGRLARWRYESGHRPVHGDPSHTVPMEWVGSDIGYQSYLLGGNIQDRIWTDGNGRVTRDFDLPAEIRTRSGKPHHLIWRKDGIQTRDYGLPSQINLIDGEYRWTDENGRAHRENGQPAFIGCDRLEWASHGNLHRPDGPAVIRYESVYYYRQDLATKRTRRHATCEWLFDGRRVDKEHENAFTRAWSWWLTEDSANRSLALMPDDWHRAWLLRILLASESPYLSQSWRVLGSLEV
jgi:hypothetical protein